MKVVILNEKNLDDCIKRLQQVTEGIYTLQNMRDVDPTTKLDKKNLPYDAEQYGCSEVLVHWMYEDRHSPFGHHMYDGSQPMIFLALNDSSAMAFDEGDVFYFYKEEVRIDAKHSTRLRLFRPGSMGWERDTIVIKLVTRPRDMSDGQKQWVANRKAVAQAEAKEWEGVLEDAEMHMHLRMF